MQDHTPPTDAAAVLPSASQPFAPYQENDDHLAQPPAGRPVRNRSALVLLVACGAPFLAGIDLFVVNVALNDIGRAFPGQGVADLSWVLNAYAIAYAALLVPLGRWADRVGSKNVFLLGLLVFTLASAAAAASTGLWWLVTARLVQAIGAAALTPTSLSLLLVEMPEARRAGAIRAWAATGAVASALGPVLGGLLVELSWRWIFVINIPVGAVLILAAALCLNGTRRSDTRPRGAIAGATLAAVGIGALALGIVKGNDWGWDSRATVGTLGVAALLLILFAQHNFKAASPLIARDLFRVRSFVWSNVAAALFAATFAASLLEMVLWMQDVWGYSAIRTGLAIAPGPLMVPLVAIGGQGVLARIPSRLVASGGCLLLAAGLLWILESVQSTPAYASAVLPGWLVCGVGVGLALPTILGNATSGLPPTQAATGSAVVIMARQVGTVLGISILIAVIDSPSTYDATHTAYVRAWWVAIVIALVAALATMPTVPEGADR